MRNYLFIIVFVLLASCKTAKNTVSAAKAEEPLSAENIIAKHSINEKSFKTLYIRGSGKYTDPKQTQNTTVEIRIKKDELIWINIKVLGIPMAKALITPKKVSYYEKINGTYFDGDFKLISNWLGTDLDFEKVQNLFIGNALDALDKNELKAEIENNLYKLSQTDRKNTEKKFYFEPENFLVKQEILEQKSPKRRLEIHYPSYTKQNEMFLPAEINIKAVQENTVAIDLTYKNITFDENLTYPFAIPEGYEQVTVE